MDSIWEEKMLSATELIFMEEYSFCSQQHTNDGFCSDFYMLFIFKRSKLYQISQ